LHILKGIVYNCVESSQIRKLNNIKTTSDKVRNIINTQKLNLEPVHPYLSINRNFRTVPEVSEYLTFYSSLPKYLHWEDRNSMAHSVEARVPFLDHRLVEFAYNLPDDYLDRDVDTKRVLREAMKGMLPEIIRTRRDKMGFTTPEELWVKIENPAWFKRKLKNAIEISNGIIKEDVLNYFENIVSGRFEFDYAYWRIILFSEWIQKFQVTL